MMMEDAGRSIKPSNGRQRRVIPSARSVPTFSRIVYTQTGPEIVNYPVSYPGSGYRAAHVVRSGGRGTPKAGSGDYHLRYARSLEILRQESQRFDRDNGIYRGLVTRAIDNILGPGLVMQARTANQRLNTTIENLWTEWCKRPEIRGLDDWRACERLALRHTWIDGDVGAIKLTSGKIQMIESERIKTNRSDDLGVKLDEYGAITEFYIVSYDAQGNLMTEAKTIPVTDFVFMAHRDRASQTRGCPVMASSFPMLHRINDVCDSEAIAWQILSRLAVAIYQQGGPEIGYTGSAAEDSTETQDLSTRYNDIGEAIIFRGEPGEEIKGIDHNLPSVNFPESIRMFLRLLGLPLGLPLELVLLDFSKTNYSASRAALEQSYRTFRCWQRQLIRQWHDPIYDWKVDQWVEAGLLPARADVHEHEVFAPPFPWLDLLKEAEAKALAVECGFSLHADVLAGENKDRVDYVERRQAEIEQAVVAAEAVNTAHPGAKIPWQLFAGLKPPREPEPVAQAAEEVMTVVES